MRDPAGSTASAYSSITVLLVTYNHAAYIQKALEGLFAQDVSGTVTVVVADDGSTDDTVSRIRSLARLQPGNFEFVFLDSSMNRGITQNYERGFSACTSEFVAVLEGDDYWISPAKLRVQSDILRAHLECDVCSANYYVFFEQRAAFELRIPRSDQPVRFLSARDLIADNVVGNFSTCMYRRSALMRLSPRLFRQRSYDWILNISLARWSLIAFLETPLSVYRLHQRGAWSGASILSKIKDQLALIPHYDKLTDGIFTEDFASLSTRLRQQIAVMEAESAAPEENPIVRMATPMLVRLALSPSMAWARKSAPIRLKRFIRKLLTKA